jgi:hypothetical protein
MSSTEAPFRATLPIEIMGHKILLTSGADTHEQFMEQWAQLADQMSILVMIYKNAIGVVNAESLLPAAPATPAAAPAAPVAAPAPVTPPAPTAPPASTWGAPMAPAPATGPMCEHGQPMKLVPAGVSKSTGRPYRGFYACAAPRDQQCDKRITV